MRGMRQAGKYLARAGKLLSVAVALALLQIQTAFAETAEAAHHEGGGGGLPQFNPQSFASQVFWLAIAFVTLYVFFSRKTLPDISRVIENRKSHIESDLQTARQLTAEAEKVEALYQEGLNKAREESSRILKDAEDAMKAKTAQQLAALREKSEQQTQQLERRLTDARASAMSQMNTIAAEIASEAAHRIVGISPDREKASAIVRALSDNKAEAA